MNRRVAGHGLQVWSDRLKGEAMENQGSNIGQAFIAALAENSPSRYEALLTEDAGLRVWNWQGNEALRPRDKAIGRLIEMWNELTTSSVECLSMVTSRDRVALELDIRAMEHGRHVKQNGSAFLTLRGGLIEMIDLYYARAVPSGPPPGWIAPQTLSDIELEQLLQSSDSFDPHARLPLPIRFRLTPHLGIFGIDAATPGVNGVGLARLTLAEADDCIEEVITFHRERGIGFHWTVSPLDTPADLGERLERHGMMYAGASTVMARRGLDDPDILVNPELTIQRMDGRDPVAFQQAVEIIALCFHMPADQVDKWQAFWLDDLMHPAPGRDQLAYLAFWHEKPVGIGRLILEPGFAHLSGAGTLSEYRGHRVYSTLLKKRLEDARVHGYQIATIDAGPMSRRVVERYGFKEYGRTRIYGWMPIMDPEVIRQIVPDE